MAEYYSEESVPYDDDKSTLGSEDDEDLNFSGGDSEDGAGIKRGAGTSCQVLTPDMISKKMFDIIHDVNAVFEMPTPHVRILLTACKWDKEKLMDRYYAGDQQSLFKEAHLVYPPNRSKQPKPVNPKSTAACGAAATPGQEYICDICFYQYALVDMPGLECGHSFCRACWNSYLEVMIMCLGQGQTIECPASDCKIVVDEETVLTLLREKTVKAKYQHLITNSFVQDHPHLKWCPAPGCPNALHVTSADYVPVTCACGHRFCFICLRDSHEPILCAHLKLWLKKCDDDSETSNWIHVNTKECPKCRSTIEKSGGCNHMICSSCKMEFCWTCLGPWEPHGSSWYHCNRFNEVDSQDARDKQACSRAALERYLFYCNRYMNHLKSSKMEYKLYEMATRKMLEMQSLNMSWIEAQFVKRAVDILCLCRQTLMFTYAFAFFLRKNNHTLIFEDNQRDMEMATETLSGYLERDITGDSISNVKIFVQDKTKYCEARRQVLLDHVYEGYEQEIWEFSEFQP
ncbi:E3 ubiquitin-protein ligase arih1l-like [Halichondria panicea]|uniref:E3 ubiquitin-protein ligase arih1l-like n=1 Tax=Halichondria panicea TaxID=6063 RepID=UPI00312B7EF0